MVIMERTKPLVRGTGLLQGNVAADHIHDIAGSLDLRNQRYPIVCQESPGGKEESRERERRLDEPSPLQSIREFVCK
jgi:hypothetical protein